MRPSITSICKHLVAISFAAILAFTGCTATSQTETSESSFSNSSSVQSTNESTLVYGSTDYTAINPALYEHGEINSLIFAGLTAHDSQNQVIPAMAESWDYDASTYTYTFHLKEGILWHDGEPFTAEDVKFTLEAIMDPDNASEIASNYEDITQIQVIDEQTIAISMSAPNVAMLDYLTIGILPKHLLDGKDLTTDSFNQNPIGTGPYQLTQWTMGQQIVLTKNTSYFGGEPSIDTVIFKIVPDEKARALQLQSGELDLAQISPQDAQLFQDDQSFTVYDMETADYRGILYNFNSPLFSEHRELPAALSYAIDRDAIVDGVLLGKGEPAYSPLQKSPYNNPDIEHYDYNPDKTRQLLENNGWQLNSQGIYEKNGQPLSFTIHCSEGDQVRIDMAMLCAQQLQQVGADVTAQVDSQIDWANQEAYLIGWGSPFDPDDHTYKVFGTDKGANYSSYSNPEVDRLLTLARETDIPEQRMSYYQQFQQVLSQDPPFTFLAYTDAVYVGKSNIQGMIPDMVLGHHGVGIFGNISEWSIQ